MAIKLSKKNKKALLLCVLMIGVLVAGYLNFQLASSPADGSTKQVSSTSSDKKSGKNYFDEYREKRSATREKELSYIEAVMSSTEVKKETKDEAQSQKLALVASMEKELTSEGIIKTKLNMDAVVSVKDGNVNVVVDKTKLSDEQVAQIVEIIKSETKESAQNIKIMPQT